jgi:hypothetical protein
MLTTPTNRGRKTLRARSRRFQQNQARPRVELLEDRTLLSTTYLVTNANDIGPGSLRQAIAQADTAATGTVANPDRIQFDIGSGGPQIISPQFSLPEITEPMVIDATTQASYAGVPLIVLDGPTAVANSLSGADGFDLASTATGSSVKGFVIQHFSNGISIFGSNNVIANNSIGLNGVDPSAGVIPGNAGYGIGILGGGNNLIESNFIGVDPTGSGVAGNAGDGIALDNSSNNTIGGTAAGAGNVISGNGGNGINIEGPFSTGNVVAGNFVGTDATGTKALGASLAYGFRGGIGQNANAALNIPQLNTNPGAATTVSFWMDWNGMDANRGIIPIGFADYVLLIHANFGASPAVYFNIAAADVSFGLQDVAPINGLAGQWHLITAVFVNSNMAQDQLWIDGVQQTLQQVDTLAPVSVSTSAYIGSYGGDPNHSFDGALDHVAFFNQQLTPAQIQAEYAASLNGTMSSTILGQGPVAYYPLNETSGTVAHDASGNGNDGTTNASYVTVGIPGGPTGNQRAGVAITGGASGNTVGGTVAGARNVISGNGSYGVDISDSGTSNNVVENNLVGVGANGSNAVANTNAGVLVVNGATSNIIGDVTGGTRNIISGNRNNGVEISGSGSSGNEVAGNIIGLDVSGANEVGNQGAGVVVDSGASGNTIGGLTSTPGAGAGNVISGNNFFYSPFINEWSTYGVAITGTGIYSDQRVLGSCTANLVDGNIIGLDGTGTKAYDANGQFLGNENGVLLEFASNSTIGGTIAGARNIISNNNGSLGNGDGEGIQLASASGNLISGNYIGTDITGTVAHGNGHDGGILIYPGNNSNNTIGGTSAAARNVISGNVGGGIVSINLASNGNQIEGNYIGTDVTGDVALPNSGAGVSLSGTGNTVGGTTPGAGNIIAANDGGVAISAGHGNLVQGNIIGRGANGTPLPNSADGVAIYGGPATSNNVIGGTAVGAGNVIFGSRGYGVFIEDLVTSNLVSGNQIEGNAAAGVRIDSAAANNTIGGTTAGSGNLISGNAGPGVLISDSGTSGNVIQANFIGTDASGATNLGNAGPGVLIENGATNNIVGTIAAGAGNTIAFNVVGGVVVQDTSTTGNAIRGNAIHDNTAIGIGLGGTIFVANDSQGHAGPNLFQDYPVLEKATISVAGHLVVSYSVPAADTSATYPLAIDFYLADATGQGKTYLASDTYSATGLASVDLGSAAALGVVVGESLVATAADAAGNTSEFSPLTGNAVVTISPSILVLDPTASGALSLSGNASIRIPGIIVVDSNSKTALTESGNAQVTAASIQVVGGVSTTGNATLSPAATAGVASVPDPLASLSGPNTAGFTNYGSASYSAGSHTLQPGIYSQINASGNASLTLSPGLYVIEGGGFTVTGNASIGGSGVTIYNTGSNYPNAGGSFAGISLSGNGTFSLTAAASGVYAGILIFQSRANTRALSLGGNAAFGLTGTIYAPSAQLIMSGNASVNGALIVDRLTLSGNGASTQVADGSATSTLDTASAGTLLAGNLTVYVSDPRGLFTANEQARLLDAINAWNALLVPYSVTISEVSDPGLANVVIDTGLSSAAGSATDGVLGSYSSTGEITILQGWNWYDGSNPGQIGANQYDFQTVVTHELGHALGLGGSADPTSPMYEVLAAGAVRRTPGIADLNIPEPPDGADPERAALPATNPTYTAFVTVLGGLPASQTESGTLFPLTFANTPIGKHPGNEVDFLGFARPGPEAFALASGSKGTSSGVPTPVAPVPVLVRDTLFARLARQVPGVGEASPEIRQREESLNQTETNPPMIHGAAQSTLLEGWMQAEQFPPVKPGVRSEEDFGSGDGLVLCDAFGADLAALWLLAGLYAGSQEAAAEGRTRRFLAAR